MTRHRPILGTTWRACGYPGCVDQLDMAAVLSGQASPRGWMRNRLVEYLCQPHAHGAHVPAWDADRSTAPVAAIPTCSCGWAGAPAGNLAGAGWQWRTHVRPVWLLDVNGVLDATRPGWSTAPFRATVYSRHDNYEYQLRWAPPLLAGIRRLHTYEAVEIRWCTTWCPEIEVIEEAMRLPAFPCELPTDGPLPKGVQTWAMKVEAARAVVRSGRRLIWTDDEIPTFGPLHDELVQAGALLICTSEKRGLLPGNLEQIEAYALGQPR